MEKGRARFGGPIKKGPNLPLNWAEAWERCDASRDRGNDGQAAAHGTAFVSNLPCKGGEKIESSKKRHPADGVIRQPHLVVR